MRKKVNMRSSLTTVVFFFLLSTGLLAQPSNDECDTAIEITEVTDWCSEPGAFTNQGATASGYGPATCFSGGGNDVWFRFTPVATDVTITVIGAASQIAGNTLRRPEVALYTGSCTGEINEEQCETDNREGNNIIELYKGGLAVGLTYFIRVQGGGGQTGTFQLCIENFNPPVAPGGDCFDAAVLCNKDPFVVQQVSGAGSDPTEANDAPCLANAGPGNVESNSTWFTWTAANDGTLEFTLTPLNPADDLDFVVYELPNGPLNCADKIPIRCMASGSFEFPSPCMGPTGLREGEDDIAEPAGCNDPRQTNFLLPLDMEEGKSYALMVNNFSATGNGFKIEFGGTGEFQGPQADFTTSEPDNTVCVGQEISFIDASAFALGSIVNWTWSFGEDAQPASTTGQGPHAVRYTTAGLKSIVLTIESDRGCIVTEIGTILVECCSDHFSVDAAIADLQCPDDNTGAIDLEVINNYAPYTFQWSNGAGTRNLNTLTRGDYMVTITDAARCDTVVTFTVASPDTFDIDTLITMPTCNGGTDGAISLQTNGGSPPYSYNWENQGFSADNSLTNLPVGNYSVVVRDDNDCETTLDIPVRELELILDPAVTALQPPSCFGFSDGAIEVVVDNGQGPYEYDWMDGRGFRDENSLRDLSSGFYEVEVIDANLCRGTFTFDMQDPPAVTLDFDVMDASCNGVQDGEATAIAGGGVGGFTYSWSDGQRDSLAAGLGAGTYSVTVLDANQCPVQGSVIINEPAVTGVEVTEIVDARCFGEASGQVTVAGIGGNPPYSFSLDGVSFQPESTFVGLPAGSYTIVLTDALGCTETVTAEVGQPAPLIVDAGPDQTIQLGFETRLRAIPNDPNVSFQWAPPDALSCSDCPDPVAGPVETTPYTVTVVDPRGCAALDSLLITVSPDRPVYIPNAFTPNGDGFNDYFTLFSGPAAEEIRSLRIFDRWGELIYEGESIPLNEESAGWDGTFRGQKLDSGVFVYLAEVAFIDGQIIQYSGDVSLLR